MSKSEVLKSSLDGGWSWGAIWEYIMVIDLIEVTRCLWISHLPSLGLCFHICSKGIWIN